MVCLCAEHTDNYTNTTEMVVDTILETNSCGPKEPFLRR